jgi:hypothetical protein
MSQGKDLLGMADRLFKAEKSTWDQLCQEIGNFFAPHKADFTDEIYVGEEFASYITDPVPIIMARDLGDAFGTMLRSDEWFKVAVDDQEIMDRQHVREHLDYMTEVTRAMLYDRRGNFTRMAKEHEHDFANFGGGVSSVNLNKQMDGFRFRNWHMRDCAWCENDDGMVDRLARKIKSTARNIEQKFDGRKNVRLPEHIKNAAKNNPDQKLDLHHMAVPIDMYTTETRDFPKDATFVSVYLSDQGDIISEEPEYQFPYIVSRWRTVRGWGPYPLSPATMTALPHARMLQSVMLTFIEAGEKAVDPPLIATSETISSPIDITAGGVTWADSEYDERLGQVLRPLDLAKNIPLNENMLDSFHRLMADTMYISKLNIPGTSSETAYEVAQIVQQNIRQLQPIFEPAQDEIIYQYLDRVVNTALRLGAYGPIEEFPEELQGREVTYTFNNPLQQERERRKVAQFQEAVGIAGAVAEVDPSILIDAEPIQWFRDAMRGTGAPADWLKPEDEADQQRAQLAEAQQMQQELEQVAQVAETAKMGGEAAQAVDGALGGAV